MRPSLAFALLAAPFLACACTTGSSTLQNVPDAGVSDDGGSIFADAGAPPMTEACTGPAAACLSGTAGTHGFQATPRRMEVLVYKIFPSGSAGSIAKTPVALDGTWAIDNLPSWGHYFVQLAADFGTKDADGGVSPAAATVVGPVTVPQAGKLDLKVEPLDLVVAESNGAVQLVQGHVFDPTSGVELAGGVGGVTVTIDVGGTSTPIPYDLTQKSFYWKFPTPPPAQATYTISTSGAGFGSAPVAWHLTAAPPTFTPSITTPASMATIPAGMPLAVTWPAQATADYVLVELYRQTMGQWASAYGSASPEAPDTTQETIPGADTSPAGAYLLNVDFTSASCPVAGDGCVLSSVAASAQLTAQ